MQLSIDDVRQSVKTQGGLQPSCALAVLQKGDDLTTIVAALQHKYFYIRPNRVLETRRRGDVRKR